MFSQSKGNKFNACRGSAYCDLLLVCIVCLWLQYIAFAKLVAQTGLRTAFCGTVRFT